MEERSCLGSHVPICSLSLSLCLPLSAMASPAQQTAVATTHALGFKVKGSGLQARIAETLYLNPVSPCWNVRSPVLGPSTLSWLASDVRVRPFCGCSLRLKVEAFDGFGFRVAALIPNMIRL